MFYFQERGKHHYLWYKWIFRCICWPYHCRSLIPINKKMNVKWSLCNEQFGFWSCDLQLLETLQEWSSMIEKGEGCDILYFYVCSTLHSTDKTILLILCLLSSCLTLTFHDLFFLLVAWIFDIRQHSLAKKITTLSLYNLVQVINKSTHMCGHIIDCVVVWPDDVIHKKSTVSYSFESDHYCTKSYFNVSVSKPSTIYRTVRNMANIDRPSIIAELSSVSEFSSVENRIQYC